jgi:hypothetical protein
MRPAIESKAERTRYGTYRSATWTETVRSRLAGVSPIDEQVVSVSKRTGGSNGWITIRTVAERPDAMFETGRIRTIVVATVLVLTAVGLGAGVAAAHNPACHQPGHQDGPHYDKGTASDTAFVHNPTLRGPDKADSRHPDHANSIHNREGSCSVGDSQSGDGGH